MASVTITISGDDVTVQVSTEGDVEVEDVTPEFDKESMTSRQPDGPSPRSARDL